MRNILVVLMLMFSVSNVFSQSISDVTTAVTLSPFLTATKMLETSAVASLRTIQSTRSIVQSRGIGGKEQLKDELLGLNEAMEAGRIHTILDIQQAGLRELFEDILSDETALNEVTSFVLEGPILFRVATVVTITLLIE